MAWSKKYEKCVRCGTQARQHAARGLCVDCYSLDFMQRHKWRRPPVKLEGSLSKEDLERQYLEQGMSLGDLALKYNCTRTAIHKRLKRSGIRRRTHSQARDLAMDKGKLVRTRIDSAGNESKVTLSKHTMDNTFFKSWSPAMAYVLGVIYTDGNLLPSSKRDSTYQSSGASRLSVAQKEPELLQKILALMGSNAKIYQGKQSLTGNPIYQFSVNDEDIYEDLICLGLSPKKSLTMSFPTVDSDCVRHFIRGCWDGDGSVYWENGNPDKPRASYISGSKRFVEEMLRQLASLGLPPAAMYSSARSKAFYFRYGGVDCVKLYHVFYDRVGEEMYLTRKYERFKSIATDFESSFTFTSMRARRKSSTPGRKSVLFPDTTRTAIAEMLGVHPRQVTFLMRSSLLRSKLQKMLANPTEAAIQYFKEELEKVL
jgi:hypothetical protein